MLTLSPMNVNKLLFGYYHLLMRTHTGSDRGQVSGLASGGKNYANLKLTQSFLICLHLTSVLQSHRLKSATNGATKITPPGLEMNLMFYFEMAA